MFVFSNVVFAASCKYGYGIATHNIDLDSNVYNPEYPDKITVVNKVLNTDTFITSDDGNCYAGYELYTRTGNDIYPLIENSELCDIGYYRSNGDCVRFLSDDCPDGRYNSVINNLTFVASEEGNCYSGFDSYSVFGDEINLLSDSSVLCQEGQYMSNGVCTPYQIGICPDGMYDTTFDSSVWSAMANGVCPYDYNEYTIDAINYACDTYENHITSDTTACLFMCDSNEFFTEVNSCASLCPVEHYKLKTGTGLEFPLYATKQITPSLNIEINNEICYVNLVAGRAKNAINMEYNNTIYHTVK